MVDNVSVTPGTGANIATDDCGASGHIQRVKLDIGGDGVSSPVAAGNGLPVSGPLTDTELRATAVPVSAASLPLPTGASTAALQTQPGVDIGDVTVNNAAGAAAVNIQDGGNSITVDGTVAVSSLGGTVQVIGELAHDSPAGTNAVAIAGYAKAAAPTDVSLDGDAVRAWYLRNGAAAVNLTAAGALIGGDATNGIDVDVTRLPALVAGTANIGDVDVLTQPARAATTDNIGAKLATDAIMNGTTALTPKFAIIDAATTGDNTLVAAVASKKVRVLALMMVAAGTVTARFESGAAGTALSGQMNLIANSGFTLPFNPVGWFETAANTLLNLELSAAISVDGMLTYVEV